MSNLALYKAFLPILRAAGRWLIRRLVRWGLPRVIMFLECRIDTISDRRKRARSKRRKRWLLWRMTWRHKLIMWLQKHSLMLTKRVIGGLENAYDKGIERIPWDKVGERFRTWDRKHA